LSNLILIPTDFERRTLEPLLARSAGNWKIELAGFGPIAAASRTSQLIAMHQPQRVCLIGIAGAFAKSQLDIGTAFEFGQVSCDGIGVGSGNEFRSAADLGWAMIENQSQPISNSIRITEGEEGRGLLTVCAASANPVEAASRAERFPNVAAEDMEGFGVALSCQLADVPLQIIRGISNRVGDRDHTCWQVDGALRAAAELALNSVLGE
jgi:futalosine hydrolase